MSNQSPNTVEANDLDWLAFRYICEELTEAEAAEFLTRLEHDLAACEALARQSLLVEATKASLEPESLPLQVVAGQSDSHWKGIVAFFLATAAVLALVMPLLRGFQNTEVESAASDLALRWAAGIELAEMEHADSTLASVDLEDLEETTDAERGFDESSTEPALTVPDWMFAAVSVQSGLSQELPPFSGDSQPVEN